MANKYKAKPVQASWNVVKFGDIIENVTERVDPAEAQTDIYVGLEHLDPDTLHLRQWGHPSEVTGQKFVFRKGDVIFGRRRAYQRKLAVAEFDGICSAHAMVVRAKPEMILPEFLPFFLQSDMFMECAIDISVGSLSPTINWKTMKIQEFPLPPIDKQKRIAKILWAADEAVQTSISVKNSLHQLYLQSISSCCFNKRNEAVRIDQIADINRESLSTAKTKGNYKFNYLDISSIPSPKIIGKLTEHAFSDSPSRARRIVKSFDILLSTVRPNLQSFARVGEVEDNLVASTGFAVLSPKDKVFGNIVFHAFFSTHFSNYCDERVTGTNYPAISAKDIGSFKIYIPREKEEVHRISEILDFIDDSICQAEENIRSNTQIGKALLEQLLERETTHI